MAHTPLVSQEKKFLSFLFELCRWQIKEEDVEVVHEK